MNVEGNWQGKSLTFRVRKPVRAQGRALDQSRVLYTICSIPIYAVDHHAAVAAQRNQIGMMPSSVATILYTFLAVRFMAFAVDIQSWSTRNVYIPRETASLMSRIAYNERIASYEPAKRRLVAAQMHQCAECTSHCDLAPGKPRPICGGGRANHRATTPAL